ncbi:MAG: glycosyltransferase family 4 protein [Candidatus Buchananbacteria bacterium]
MRIAFIGQKGIPTRQGGIEKHVEELSTRLVERGFDVTVYGRPNYTGDDRKEYDYRGVKIIQLPSLATKHLDAITHTFAATIHALFQNYDIIHYHGVGPSLLSFIPRLLKPRAKVVVTFHCIDRTHQKWGRFARLVLAVGEWTAVTFPHKTIVISNILKKYCLYRFDKECQYIPNGVAVTRPEDEEYNLIKNGLVAGEYIVAVSRLVPHKGVHTLIKAYNSTATDKKLIIIGDGANTDAYVAQIKNLAKGNPNIILAGLKSGNELAAIFKNACLFVQPSEAEGLSIALLEAMAYGVPAIISNIEENQEPAEGLALEFINKSWESLAKQLEFALVNPSEIKRLADLAQKRAATEYDWQDIAQQTSALYHELAKEKRLEILTAKYKHNG